MIYENLSKAKGILSAMVNAALAGEDVAICKDGVPGVKLVPVRSFLADDLCREIPSLAIRCQEDPSRPLDSGAWGDWA